MNALWSQLVGDLRSSLKRLLTVGTHEFWCTGRMLVHVERQSVLVVDGECFPVHRWFAVVFVVGWAFSSTG